MTITWYGHSCFKVEGTGGSVVFDPYKPGSVPGLELPPLSADYCICSHGHDDHCFSDGVKLSGKRPDLKMTQIKTYHDDKQGSLRGDNLLTLVQVDGCRILHTGDIGEMLDDAAAAQLGHVDVLLLPVGGYYTVDAATAKQIKDKLQPFITIPMHYRGPGFGYDVIETVEPFAALCSDVTYFDTNRLDPASVPNGGTVILTCPKI